MMVMFVEFNKRSIYLKCIIHKYNYYIRTIGGLAVDETCIS